MSILVFGNSLDRHITSVRDKLHNQYGVRSYLIDHNLPLRVELNISNDGNVSIESKDFDFSELRLAWNRYKLALPEGGSGQAYRADYVNTAQWIGFSQGLAESLGLRIINQPTSRLSSKFSQLLVARSCGLKIPYTIVPASKDKVLADLRHGRSLVIKTIAYPNTPARDDSHTVKAIMTARVKASEIEGIDESQLIVCPHLFQEEIEKKYELRIIATMHRYFAFATYAHQEELTEVDWRYGNAFIDFFEIELRETLYAQIRRYLTTIGLIYGVFDVIVDREDHEWFLECNTEGQWYWLEAKYGTAISSAIAEALARVAQEQGERPKSTAGPPTCVVR